MIINYHHHHKMFCPYGQAGTSTTVVSGKCFDCRSLIHTLFSWIFLLSWKCTLCPQEVAHLVSFQTERRKSLYQVMVETGTVLVFPCG